MTPLRTTPNLLTVLRIGILPILLACVWDGRFGAALVLFLAAAASDALDGWLARLLDQRTTLGQYLDPIADKLLLTATFVALACKGLVPVWIAMLVVARDVGILASAAVLFFGYGLRHFAPSRLGKANTFAQMMVAGSVLLGQISSNREGPPSALHLFGARIPIPGNLAAGNWLGDLQLAALGATLALIFSSAAHYLWRSAHRGGSESIAA